MKKVVGPQPGFQIKFLQSVADITIGGGGAGGGKTWALLMEPLYHYRNPAASAIFFRRTTPQLTSIEGPWDKAQEIYGSSVGGRADRSRLIWRFDPIGAGKRMSVIKFSHLQHENDKESHRGSEYAIELWDELISFTAAQFWFLLSRQRSSKGFQPFTKATTNPQSEGWVKDLISWYLYPDNYDDETRAGFPIPERDGVLTYIYRVDNETTLKDTDRERLFKRILPFMRKEQTKLDMWNSIKSITFIHGPLAGNKKLGPDYLANLNSLPEQERVQLMDGNWRSLEDSGTMFDLPSIMSLTENDFIQGGKDRTERYLTADIAMEGSDRFVIGIWDGWRLIRVTIIPRSNGREVLEAIKEHARIFQVPSQNVVYDRDGVGDYLTGFLTNSHGFRANSTPLPEPEKPGEKPNYTNLKAQLFHRMAKRVQLAGVYVDPAIPQEVRTQLQRELRAHKKKMNPGGKIGISSKDEVKERLGLSPDLADMFCLRGFFDLIRPKQKSKTTVI